MLLAACHGAKQAAKPSLDKSGSGMYIVTDRQSVINMAVRNEGRCGL